MKPITLILIGGVALASTLLTVSAITHRPGGTTRITHSANSGIIERGQYLVHKLAMCIDCHSPRTETGEFIENRHLTGAPLGFAATVPMPWMPAAPKIAGLPEGYTEADTVHFLMTGERPHGLPPTLPPMPPYRLNRDDAEAVTAYLLSLR